MYTRVFFIIFKTLLKCLFSVLFSMALAYIKFTIYKKFSIATYRDCNVISLVYTPVHGFFVLRIPSILNCFQCFQDT